MDAKTCRVDKVLISFLLLGSLAFLGMALLGCVIVADGTRDWGAKWVVGMELTDHAQDYSVTADSALLNKLVEPKPEAKPEDTPAPETPSEPTG